MNELLKKTLVDAARFLESEQVPYALIGGLAASLRGQPRVTVDVDMVIAADQERALNLLQVLHQSKFEPLFDGAQEVVQKAFILPLRHRQTKIKVDLALGLSGFEQQAIAHAEPVDFGGAQVSVVRVEDLLVMKALAGRPQDEQDLRGLVIAQGDRLDWDHCLHIAKELGEALDINLVDRIRSLRHSFEP